MNIGVYQITNLVNGKYYIGSSIHLKKRLNDHVSMLKSGTHQNIYLQHSYNKHGIKNFKIEIIEYGFDKDDVRSKEQKWIDKLDACNMNKGFNLNRLANGGSLKGELSNNYGNRGIKNPLSKQIAQVDVTTKEVVNVWGSLCEVKRNINVNMTHLSNICEYFVETNFLKKSKGFFWCYLQDVNRLPQGKEFTFQDRKPILDHSKKGNKRSKNGMARKVVRLMSDGTFIDGHNSVVEASEVTGINAQIIYNNLFRKPKQPKNYKWMYLEEYEQLKSAN